ncbi:MFS transporter [Lentibacillus salinarum]|uniref:MFS transporter n=1 Tax=Lentibacillus salinarum TaxID=446820 RepID=A0ABW3ZWJ7_9BACI
MFSNKNFSVFFFGQSVSTIGDGFQQIALVFLVLQLGGGGVELALAQSALVAPRIVSLIWGGVLVDRLNVKHILWGTDIFRFFITIVLLYFLYIENMAFILLYVLLFLSGLASGLFYPAFNSIVPHIVEKEKLEKANSWVQSISQTAILIGPPLAGLLVGSAGVMAGFFVNALTFLFAGVSGLFIKVKKEVQDKGLKSRVWQEFVDGFRYIWRVKWLFNLLVVDLFVSFAIVGPLTVVLPLYSEETLNLGGGQLGLVMSAYGTGSVIGMFTVPKIKERYKSLHSFYVLQALQGLVLLLLAIQSLPVVLTVLCFVGIFNGISNVILISKIHSSVSLDWLGRTMSFVSLASFGSVPLSQLAAGGLMNILSSSLIFIFASIIMFVAGTIGFSISHKQNNIDVGDTRKISEHNSL